MEKATKDQEEKALRFVNYCYRRFKTDLEEDQIAAEMGFRRPEVLYKQLERDGSPVCGVCGQLYPDTEHRGEHKGKRKKKQPGVGGGRRVKLPDVSAARSLFRAALEELDMYISFVDIEESWLEGNVEEGRFKGKHFITHSVDRDYWEVRRREEFTEEGWRELCEHHGTDPGRDQIIWPTTEAGADGVGRAPSRWLTRLIAAYVLVKRPLPLIEALHHEPDSAAWEKINANVDELHKVARHLATRVRGGIVESGTGIEEVSHQEHFAAWLIRGLEEEGADSDEEIHEHLKKTFPTFAAWLTPKGIDRIRRMHLKPPE